MIGLGDNGGTLPSNVPMAINLLPTKQNSIDLTSNFGLGLCCHSNEQKFSCNNRETLSQLDQIAATRVPTHASQNAGLDDNKDLSKQSHHSKPWNPIATNNHPNDNNLTEKVCQAISEHFPFLQSLMLEPDSHFLSLGTFVCKFIKRC